MSSPLPLLSADSASLQRNDQQHESNNNNDETSTSMSPLPSESIVIGTSFPPTNNNNNNNHRRPSTYMNNNINNNNNASTIAPSSSSSALLLQDEGLRALLLQDGIINASYNQQTSNAAAMQKYQQQKNISSAAAILPLSHRNQSLTSLPPTPKSSNQSNSVAVSKNNHSFLNPIASTISSTNNVMVAVRVRPLSTNERQYDSRVCVEARGEHAVRVPNFMTKHQAQILLQRQEGEKKANEESKETVDEGSPSLVATEEEHATTTAINIYSQVMLTCLSGAPIPSNLDQAQQQQQQQIANNADQRRYNFGFQAVFGEKSKQSEVYNAIAHPVVESVLSGYNGCIFAYGQTSGGKTYTVFGDHPQKSAVPAKKVEVVSPVVAGAGAEKNENKVATPDQQEPAVAAAAVRGSAQQQKSQQQQQHADPNSSNGNYLDGQKSESSKAININKQQNNEQEEDLRGIIPRAAHHIISALHEMYPDEDSQNHLHHNHNNPHHRNFEVTLNFTEIYLEKVRDLLEPQRQNLPIRERDGLFFVDQCSEHRVESAAAIVKLLERGSKNRVTSSSKMNDHSSRSHSILTISIRRRLSEGHTSCSRLQLVDLAGSERVGKSGTQAATAQFEEACAINKSLTHLSEVITAILENRSHIPYRSSALTKLLSASLGGNSKTAVIVCCSPSTYNEQETLSSLRFGSSVSGVKNRATMNRLVTEEQMRKYVSRLWTVVKLLEKENDLLRQQVQVAAQTSADPEALGHMFQLMAENNVSGGVHNVLNASHGSNINNNNNQSLVVPSPMTLLNQTGITSASQNNNNNNNRRNSYNTMMSSSTITPNSLALQFVQQIAKFGRPMSTQTVTSTSGRAENVYSAFSTHNKSKTKNSSRNKRRNTTTNNNLDDDFNESDQHRDESDGDDENKEEEEPEEEEETNNLYGDAHNDDDEHDENDEQNNYNRKNNNMKNKTKKSSSSSSPEMMMQSIFGPRSASPAAQSFGSDMQILLTDNAMKLLRERSKSHQELQPEKRNNSKNRKSKQRKLSILDEQTQHEKNGNDDDDDVPLHLASPLIPEANKLNVSTFESSGSAEKNSKKSHLSNNRNNNNGIDAEKENAEGEEEPVTSREFSPSPPALPKHLHHHHHQQHQQGERVIVRSSDSVGNHDSSSSSSSASSSSSCVGEASETQQNGEARTKSRGRKRRQQKQQEEAVEDRLRYVSILKDLNEAIREVDDETADADEILRSLQEQKMRDKNLLIEKEHEFEWLQREREMAEKLRESERIREALQMNLSMLHFSIKESERSRVKALRLLEDQAMQFSHIAAELERTKTKAREAEQTCEEFKARFDQLAFLAKNNNDNAETNHRNEVHRAAADAPADQQENNRNNAYANLVSTLAENNNIYVPVSSSLATKQRMIAANRSKQYDQRSQTEIYMSDFRENDPLASLTVAPLKFEDLVAAASSSVNNNNNNNSSSSQNSSPYSKNSQNISNNNNKAAEVFLDRALAAEKLLADANTSISKLRDEKDHTDSECSALKRQIAVMEQRLIALKRITDKESNTGNDTESSSFCSVSLDNNQNNNNASSPNYSQQQQGLIDGKSNPSMMSAQRLAALRAARSQQRGNVASPNSIHDDNASENNTDNNSNQEAMKNLQERTESMKSAAERLQQETRKFDSK